MEGQEVVVTIKGDGLQSEIYAVSEEIRVAAIDAEGSEVKTDVQIAADMCCAHSPDVL